MTGAVFTMCIMSFVAFIVMGLGIYQIKSDKPVGFYSGVEPPKPEELTDVRAWNIKHGAIWIVYGIVIIVSSVLSVFLLSGALCAIGLMGGTILPFPLMLWYHHRLSKLYIK